jgi:hypothetical protein
MRNHWIKKHNRNEVMAYVEQLSAICRIAARLGKKPQEVEAEITQEQLQEWVEFFRTEA